jgi:histidinol-phosphate aminotransferase
LARLQSVAIEQIVVGSGIDDLLGLAARTFLDPGDSAVTSLGAYPTFTYLVAGCGGQAHRVPYQADRNDLAALAATARRLGARLVYLANPDNPTGSWHAAADVRAFVARLPSGCLLLLDEAYAEFAPPEAIPPLEPEGHPVVRLRTFSKAHGLAGARIGYAIASREIVAAFDRVRLHFGVNSIAQAGARASLRDHSFLQGVVQAVAEGRRDYAALAGRLGLVALPSAANFVAIDMGGAAQARATVRALLDRGVFVRMPGAPPLDRCVRVTVGTPAERASFARIFTDLVTSGDHLVPSGGTLDA